MKNCAQCGRHHNRKKFCSNTCKDRYHNEHNPRGYGLLRENENDGDAYSCAGQDAMEDGWDGHKNAFCFKATMNLQTLRNAFGMTQAVVAKEIGVHPVHISLYERERPVSSLVKQRIDTWIDRHLGADHAR